MSRHSIEAWRHAAATSLARSRARRHTSTTGRRLAELGVWALLAAVIAAVIVWQVA